MAISDGHGLPLAVHVASASPHETKLVEPTLQRRFLAETPERLIGDRAYDSDPLDAQIRERFGVELVAPHRGFDVTQSEFARRIGVSQSYLSAVEHGRNEVGAEVLLAISRESGKTIEWLLMGAE